MYGRILVPLDGSSQGEIVLPYVYQMATGFNTEILLVSVAEPLVPQPDQLHRSYLSQLVEQMQRDLREWEPKGEPAIQSKVLLGDPADEILKCAEQHKASIIVMASRGRSSRGPWILGNVAAKVLRATDKPIILVRSPAKSDALRQKRIVRKVLVPLDGSPIAEQVLPHAEAVARTLGSDLLLFHVFEPMRKYAGGLVYRALPDEVVNEENDRRKQAGLSYLDEISKKFKAPEILVSIEVTRGSPAEQILDYAETHGTDLIAMSTHGRSGIGRWVFGSVTDKVLHSGDTAVLVVRASQS
jgi:nucleotide-binding universal stress UspA family protein